MADPRGYQPDRAGWNRIANSPDMLDACLSEAERGRVWAESESPVDSGRYATSWRVEAASVAFGRYGPRAAAELWNDAPWAATVEFGSDPVVIAGVARPGERTGYHHPGNSAQRVTQRTAEYLAL